MRASKPYSNNYDMIKRKNDNFKNKTVPVGYIFDVFVKSFIDIFVYKLIFFTLNRYQ